MPRLAALTIAALSPGLVASACSSSRTPPAGGSGGGGQTAGPDQDAAVTNDDGGPAVMTRAELQTALLGAFGACALSTAREFQTAAVALEAATAALAATPGDDTRAAARQAFQQALDVWQIAEQMQFGPAAPRASLGGQEFRDHIYSWSLVNACAVDELIVSRGYQSPSFATTPINQHGLDELEQLLFKDGAVTACTATSTIVATGTWAALDPADRDARRRAYAAIAAADVRTRADALVAAWDPAAGNFATTLKTAGAGSAVFRDSQQQALNAVSDGIFYIETKVKDMKLAQPLGLRDCSVPPCLNLLESRYAARSKANVAANLTGFRRLVQGCEADYAGLGLDDLLRAAGADALATNLAARTAAVETALAAIEEPDLGEALVADFASVRALYDALKGVTDLLKTEVVTLLDLDLPMGLEGDND